MFAISKIRFIKQMPNILTMVNMLLGLLAVIVIMRTDFPQKELLAAALIIFGGFVDFLDGYLACKLNAVTDMGKQLDSFADLITFGIAPICLMHYITLSEHFIFITIASGIFLMAGAYRLARYNLNDFSSYFMGLPITAAGVALGIYCAVFPWWANLFHPGISTVITTIAAVLLSLMMVSKTKVRRFAFRKDEKDTNPPPEGGGMLLGMCCSALIKNTQKFIFNIFEVPKL